MADILTAEEITALLDDSRNDDWLHNPSFQMLYDLTNTHERYRERMRKFLQSIRLYEIDDTSIINAESIKHALYKLEEECHTESLKVINDYLNDDLEPVGDHLKVKKTEE